MRYNKTLPALCLLLAPLAVNAADGYEVDDSVIAQQRAELAAATDGEGYGPQSPRDIDQLAGNNRRAFGDAPSSKQMNLCNIHFHKNAEHKGGEFTTYAGNGDGMGFGTGYKYDGELTAKELRDTNHPICQDSHGSLEPGDTIELHYVHTSSQVEPGPSLNSCLSPAIVNPQLRVEAQVFVLVNDRAAADFKKLAKVKKKQGYYQAVNIPEKTGYPVQYAGSTTGPSYNTKGSPLQVSWSVRPKVMKVDINTVGEWCQGNQFEETGAHGVRNLVFNKKLLSKMRY